MVGRVVTVVLVSELLVELFDIVLDAIEFTDYVERILMPFMLGGIERMESCSDEFFDGLVMVFSFDGGEVVS